jgi:hypothetical protein
MYSLTRIRSSGFAAVGALVVLAVASIPTCADEPAQNPGPVGPNQPILATVGSKRVVAFYLPNGGQCAVQAVAADSAARFRVRFTTAPGYAPRQCRERVT